MRSSRSASSNSYQSNSNQSNSNHSSSDDSCSQELRLQVKMVAGELENVLGELKTVVGDLRTLVSQIDEVTSKIDKEYGLDADTLDKAKRRLSTSVLETRASRKHVYRLSGSQSFDIVQPGYHREFMSAAEIRDLSPSVSSRHSSTAYRKRMQWLLNPQPGHTGSDMGDNRVTRAKTKPKSFSKPELGSKPCYGNVDRLDRSAEELSRSRTDKLNIGDENHCKNGKQNTSSTMIKRHSGQFDHIPRAQELMALRMVKCNFPVIDKPLQPVPNGIIPVTSQKPKRRHHPINRRKSSKSSPNVEYSGVYEKELDSLLECDELQNQDSFDDTQSQLSFTDAIDNANKAYAAHYDRDVNTWTAYTMVHLDAHGFSDEQLSETTETTSDILNDNVSTRNFEELGIKFT